MVSPRLIRGVLQSAASALVLVGTQTTEARHIGPLHSHVGGAVSGPGHFMVGGGFAWYGPPFYMTIDPLGRPMMFVPTFPSFVPTAFLPIQRFGGPAPMQVRAFPGGGLRKPSNPSKATQLVTIGDRLFRAGNVKRAAERYGQALRADPAAATPRVRLAQVALLHDQYSEAANHFREALAAEPDWLAKAPNIAAVYAEPADFRRQIARLESRVHAEPEDRDAWLVLGAELFLSGQTRRAGDVFLRLSDRKADPALAAFLDATTDPEMTRRDRP